VDVGVDVGVGDVRCRVLVSLWHRPRLTMCASPSCSVPSSAVGGSPLPGQRKLSNSAGGAAVSADAGSDEAQQAPPKSSWTKYVRAAPAAVSRWLRGVLCTRSTASLRALGRPTDVLRNPHHAVDDAEGRSRTRSAARRRSCCGWLQALKCVVRHPSTRQSVKAARVGVRKEMIEGSVFVWVAEWKSVGPHKHVGKVALLSRGGWERWLL